MSSLLAMCRDIHMAIKYNDHGTDFERFMVGQGDEYHLCEEFNDQGYPTKAGLERAERFIARARNWTPFAWRLYDVWFNAKIARDIIRCGFFGHAYVDDSYGGPDSGAMAAHCSRCGWSFHHQLY